MDPSSESAGWLKLRRSDVAVELVSRDPLAFALLALIALRARWRDTFNVHRLNPGEALIGDYKNLGMTRQEYRTRLDRLKEWKFVTTHATNKGTVATLSNTAIFDIFGATLNQRDNPQITIKQPTANHQVTTNEEGKKGKKDKNVLTTTTTTSLRAQAHARPTVEEVFAFIGKSGWSKEVAQAYLDSRNRADPPWTLPETRNRPARAIGKDWRADCRRFIANWIEVEKRKAPPHDDDVPF